MVYDRLRDYGVWRPTTKLIADATDLTSEWTSAEEQTCDWQRKVAKSLVRKRQKLNNHYFEKVRSELALDLRFFRHSAMITTVTIALFTI